MTADNKLIFFLIFCLLLVMSGVKPITSYFKVLTKDQLELSELLDTQSSRNYRTLSLQTAITNSTLSTKVSDAYVGLTQADDLPALENGVDDDVEPVIDDDVEPVVVGLGDSIFSALDSVLGPAPLVFSNTQPVRNKTQSRDYNNRPHNWCFPSSSIAVYQKKVCGIPTTTLLIYGSCMPRCVHLRMCFAEIWSNSFSL